MKIRYLFLVFIFLTAAVTAGAQRRTVTNADLEHYRQMRVQAENDLRENYDRLGFPPPEELERRNEESRKEMLELSARLRAERLERERLQAQIEQAMWMAEAVNRQYVEPNDQYDQLEYFDGGFFPGYFFGGGGRSRRFGGRRVFQQSGYYGGGQFWPTGPSTPPRPAFNVRRR